MSTQNTRNSSQGTEVAPNGIMTPHDLLSLSSRERKQAIRSLLEYQQSTFHTLRAQVTNELEDPSKSPQEKRQLQNLLNSMNNSMERVESEYRKHEARIQRATRDSAAMERGKVAVELQELVLIEQFGDTVDPSLLKDFSRLDIGSFFVML